MICSVNRFFDNRCNQFECWLKDRGYKEEIVRQQILKARKFTRNDLLTKIPKLRGWGVRQGGSGGNGGANLSLIFLIIQPIQNLKLFYQILTC